MKSPIYIDLNLRLLPTDLYAHLIGDDFIRWPSCLWIRRDKDDVAYFLVTADVYAFLIAQVARWKSSYKAGKASKESLDKSIKRFNAISKLAHESLGPEICSRAKFKANQNPPPPKATEIIPNYISKIPGCPPAPKFCAVTEEVQSRVYFVYRNGYTSETPITPSSFTYSKTAPFVGKYPQIHIGSIPPCVRLLPDMLKYAKQERISEFIVTLAFDTYINGSLGRDLKSSIEFIDEMIRQKQSIPQAVLDEHKIRKHYLKLWRSTGSRQVPREHQPVMAGFAPWKRKKVITQCLLIGG